MGSKASLICHLSSPFHRLWSAGAHHHKPTVFWGADSDLSARSGGSLLTEPSFLHSSIDAKGNNSFAQVKDKTVYITYKHVALLSLLGLIKTVISMHLPTQVRKDKYLIQKSSK